MTVTPAEWKRAEDDARKLTCVALRRLPPHVDREEASSEALWAVVEAAQSYRREKGPFGPWARLYIHGRLCRWVRADMERTRTLLPLTPDEEELLPDPTADPASLVTTEALVDGVLAKRAQRFRRVAVWLLEGYTGREIGTKLGLSKKPGQQWARRVREALGAAYQETL
jgi:RNA polymerase sigma factor (sigma-70 family)